jgi:hypothetical protein
MKQRLMAAVLMMMSFGAVAPAAVVVVSRPYAAVQVAPVVVYPAPRYYAAPVYPVYRTYGYRVYGGYRYSYAPRYYSRGYGYRGYRR